MTKYVGLFVRDILLVLFLSVISVNCQYGCDDPNGILAGSDFCYSFHTQTLDWSAAREYCATQNGQLPVVNDSVTSSSLRDLLRNQGVNDTWLGASASHFENYDWFWISDGSRVDLQGCYQDVHAPKDLPDEYLTASGGSITDILCINECKKPSNGHAPYTYAGLQSQDTCYCGNDYSTHWKNKPVTGCGQACIGDQSRDKCGGPLKNSVYFVNGSYADWTINQPDGQICAVIDSMVINRRLYADQHCHSQYAFICQIDGTCPTSTGYSTNGGKCYYVSPTNSYNWFQAREQCKQKGGDLVKISDEVERQKVETMLENSGATAPHWIGLTRMNWKWNPTDEALSYTDWSATLTPPEVNITISQEFCLIGAAADDFRWNSASCTQNLTVVCQHNYYPTTAAPPSTVSTASTQESQSTSTMNGATQATASATSTEAGISTAAAPAGGTDSTTTPGGTPTGTQAQTTSGNTDSTQSVAQTTASGQTSSIALQTSQNIQSTTTTNANTHSSTPVTTLTTNINTDVVVLSSTQDSTSNQATESSTSDLTTKVDTASSSPSPVTSADNSVTGTAGGSPTTTTAQTPAGQSTSSSAILDAITSSTTQEATTAPSGGNSGSSAASDNNNSNNNNNNNPTSALNQNTEPVTTNNGITNGGNTGATDAVTSGNNNTPAAGGNATPQTGESTGGEDDGLSTFQIVLIIAFCILVVAIVVTTVLFVFFHKKKGLTVAPAPGGGAGYADKNSPPPVASGSHGNGAVPRTDEDGSTVGLVMHPDNDVFT